MDFVADTPAAARKQRSRVRHRPRSPAREKLTAVKFFTMVRCHFVER
jgi:hypothetical protein